MVASVKRAPAQGASAPGATFGAVDAFAARLLVRIEHEARALRNAEHQTKAIRYGRVLVYLEVGTWLGLWSPKTAAGAVECFLERMPIWRVMRRLRRAASTAWDVIDPM